MIKKLTLALDDTTVKKAKKYALKRRLSLSKLVEHYFASLTSKHEAPDTSLPPITAELSGMVNNKRIVRGKDVIAEALISKHL